MRKVLVILGQLWDEDVEWLAGAGRRVGIPAGRVLIEQGRKTESLYIILDGQVGVSLRNVGEIAVLGSGEILGEMSLVDSRPPSATATAKTDVAVLELSKTALAEKLDSDLGFSARFYKALATFLSERLRGTVQTLGYGKNSTLDEDEETGGELNIAVLDNLHLAGGRFDRIIKRLMDV
ncbi:MAG: cyclic nucleotide-binding domain-containing protein [Rhodospirillaceae bacterium]